MTGYTFTCKNLVLNEENVSPVLSLWVHASTYKSSPLWLRKHQRDRQTYRQADRQTAKAVCTNDNQSLISEVKFRSGGQRTRPCYINNISIIEIQIHIQYTSVGGGQSVICVCGQTILSIEPSDWPKRLNNGKPRPMTHAHSRQTHMHIAHTYTVLHDLLYTDRPETKSLRF